MLRAAAPEKMEAAIHPAAANMTPGSAANREAKLEAKLEAKVEAKVERMSKRNKKQRDY